MNISYHNGYKEMSESCGASIISELKKKQDQLICVATGNSPTGVYKKMAQAWQDTPSIFEKLNVIKLDEWVGIPAANPNSCESYINNTILTPLKIPDNRYFTLNGNAMNKVKECERVQKLVKQKGPIDICILGLGKNGHLGFNEPAKKLKPHCHIAKLAKTSLEHEMTETMLQRPMYGMTLGMADILGSRKIILLISGLGKKRVITELLNKKISTQLPASFLWLHQNVECYIDSSALLK